jgi:hypothetical protein
MRQYEVNSDSLVSPIQRAQQISSFALFASDDGSRTNFGKFDNTCMAQKNGLSHCIVLPLDISTLRLELVTRFVLARASAYLYLNRYLLMISC